MLAASIEDAEAYRASGGAEVPLLTPQFSESRVRALVAYCREVGELADPVGELIAAWELSNGLHVEERRVPLGVVAWAFHGRPHTAVEAVALALRSGNATVLIGTEPTRRANAVVAGLAAAAVESAGLPLATVTFIAETDQDALRELAQQYRTVDLIKQRGGRPLHNVIGSVATVPVIYAIDGNCHLYVDADADVAVAVAIALDAKTTHPGRCESIETMLVHAAASERVLPSALRALYDHGVELRLDPRALEAARRARVPAREAGEDDWSAEYRSLVLAVVVLDSLDEAIEHIATYGTGHSETIVTECDASARTFAERVDAACVYVNASTRFSDGLGLGLGPDFGNSTQKLPMRGPIAVRDLSTRKYVVTGDGQVRG